MTFMMMIAGLLMIALTAAPQEAQEAPTAESIMAKVAANQEKAETERGRYLYVQHADVSSRKGRKIMCEELTDFRVVPTSGGSNTVLLKLDGKLWHKEAYIHYDRLEEPKKDAAAKPAAPSDQSQPAKPEANENSASVTVDEDDTDRDLVENMRQNLLGEKSKDGINARLFPLTPKGQQDYLFKLIGREQRNGRDVFHIEFTPKDRSDFGWKGDAFIDATAYQPVVVRTTMSRKIPIAVRALLGTNVPGLGFTVIYAPQPDGVWLPVSFGTEFKIHVLFFFNREIVISAENTGFEKTHVTSKIVSTGPTDSPGSDIPHPEQ